jgi:hypothetical protein
VTRRTVAFATVALGLGTTVLSAVGDYLRIGRPWFSRELIASSSIADWVPRLSSTTLMALAAAGLTVLVLSRAVPRWWSLAYAAAALGLIVAIVSWEAQLAIDFMAAYHRDPDTLFTPGTPRLVDHLAIASRLLLGVLATLAIAAPLFVPPRVLTRPPAAPKRPLGI